MTLFPSIWPEKVKSSLFLRVEKCLNLDFIISICHRAISIRTIPKRVEGHSDVEVEIAVREWFRTCPAGFYRLQIKAGEYRLFHSLKTGFFWIFLAFNISVLIFTHSIPKYHNNTGSCSTQDISEFLLFGGWTVRKNKRCLVILHQHEHSVNFKHTYSTFP